MLKPAGKSQVLSIDSQAVEAFFCNGSAEEHPDRKDTLSFAFVFTSTSADAAGQAESRAPPKD